MGCVDEFLGDKAKDMDCRCPCAKHSPLPTDWKMAAANDR
jgi:hypothetical protein